MLREGLMTEGISWKRRKPKTVDKFSYASFIVQQRRMDVEVKQTKLLSFVTQDNALKSQTDSAQEFAKIICPVFRNSNL